jgi:hypothetical protein
MSDVIKATEAIIDLLQPIVNNQTPESVDKVYHTLSAVINYPNVDINAKISVINGVTRYLIKSCGVDSPLTAVALVISSEHNNMMN